MMKTCASAIFLFCLLLTPVDNENKRQRKVARFASKNLRSVRTASNSKIIRLRPNISQNEIVHIGGRNYFFPSTRASSYEDAEKQCRAKGMDLISLDSPYEDTMVSKHLSKIGSSSRMVLTATRRKTSFKYLSVNDQPAPHLNFGKQVPPGRVFGDCVVTWKGAMYQQDCAKTINFACEQNNYGLQPIASAPVVQIGGREYLFPSDKASAADAAKLCQSRGMQLISLETPKESNLIMDYLKSNSLDSVLTSLTKKGDNLNWLDSVVADFVQWAPNQPAATEAKCGSFGAKGMATVACDAPSTFACEADKDLRKPIGEAEIFSIGDGKYLFPSDTGTFEEAQKMCGSRDMDLMSLASGAEASAVSDFLGSLGASTAPVMTSLQQDAGGDFSWLGGVAASVLGWAPEQPKKGQGCAGISGGQFFGLDCNQKNHFGCEAKKDDDPLSKLLSMAESTLKQIGESGYVVPKEKAKYDDASKICGSRDMSLASLETVAENDAVKDWLGDLGLSSTAILTSLKKSGVDSFDWVGGVAAQFLNWAPDQPAAAAGDCATLGGLGLSAADCNTVSNFICETKSSTTQATTTTTEDPFSKLLSIAEAEVVKLTSGNYIFPSDKKNFVDAEAACSTRGMGLASLETLAENDVVKDFLGGMGLSSQTVLTSLKSVGAGSFEWLGGIAAQFLPAWAPGGAPGNGGPDDGSCAGVTALGLKSADCDTLNHFLCEEKNSTTAAPSTTLMTPSTTTTTATTTQTVTTTVATTTTTTTATTTTTTIKPALNVIINNKTYYLSNETATREQAIALCLKRNQSLLVVETLGEHLALLSALLNNSKFLGSYSYVTSLIKTNGLYKWLNESAFDLTAVQWATLPLVQDACAAYVNATLLPFPCANASTFICEDPTPCDDSCRRCELLFLCQNWQLERGPGRLQGHGNGAALARNAGRTLTGQDPCLQFPGYALLSIESILERNLVAGLLTNLTLNLNGSFWTSLNAFGWGSFTWTSKTVTTFLNETVELQPANFYPFTCFALMQGRLANANCSNSFFFICETVEKQSALSTSGTQYLTFNSLGDFLAAKQTCRAHNKTLASLEASIEFLDLARAIDLANPVLSNASNAFFLAAEFVNSTTLLASTAYFYRWLSGDIFDAVKLGLTPPLVPVVDKCLGMSKLTKKLVTLPCDQQAFFFCEDVTTTTTTPEPPLATIIENYIYYQGLNLTFDEAEKFCASQNYTLATIDRSQEYRVDIYTALTRFLSTTGLVLDTAPVWLGHRLSEHDAALNYWNKKEPLYLTWTGNAMPTAAKAASDCLETLNGYLGVKPCADKKEFLCEKPPLAMGVKENGTYSTLLFSFVKASTLDEMIKICASFGLKPLSIQNIYDHNDVVTTINNHGLAPTLLRTSLQFTASTGQFKWFDATNTFSNAAVGWAAAVAKPGVDACFGYQNGVFVTFPCATPTHFLCES